MTANSSYSHQPHKKKKAHNTCTYIKIIKKISSSSEPKIFLAHAAASLKKLKRKPHLTDSK